jgi:hypothetical protein
VRDDPEDTELEEQLRQVAARFEPLPADLLRTAVGAYTWRTIDADLAELIFDSAVDHDDAALVRGPQQDRLLSFRCGGLTIDVEIAGAGAGRSLIGQLLPPQAGHVEIRQGADAPLTVEADELGRFSAGPLRAGPLCLRCSTGTPAGRRAVVTDWVTI